jgi:uracil-DNA glycosylase
LELGQKIAQERLNFTVLPHKNEIFRAFHLTDFDNIKAVIIGMDPYPNFYKNEPVACGLAFAPRNNEYLPPSLKQIYNQIVRDFYPEEETDYKQMDLSYWAEQGIFLLNAALTVRQGEAGSHLAHWKWFTTEVIKKINELNSAIPFCLWGKDAQQFERYVQSHNILLKAPHPVSASYSGKSWQCDHFKFISNHIKDTNNIDIKWLRESQQKSA